MENTHRAEGCSCADGLRCLEEGAGIKGEVAVTAAQSAANLTVKRCELWAAAGLARGKNKSGCLREETGMTITLSCKISSYELKT